jgi:hypothetical protein
VPQFLPKSTWNSVRNLFISGVSLGEIHRRTGIKKSTLCARAAREKWTQARQETETLKAQVVPYDPDAEVVRITSENARETRRYMSEYLMKAARKLAEDGDFPVPHTVRKQHSWRKSEAAFGRNQRSLTADPSPATSHSQSFPRKQSKNWRRC